MEIKYNHEIFNVLKREENTYRNKRKWMDNSKMLDSCPTRSVIPSNVNGLNQLNCKENTERLQRKKKDALFSRNIL